MNVYWYSPQINNLASLITLSGKGYVLMGRFFDRFLLTYLSDTDAVIVIECGRRRERPDSENCWIERLNERQIQYAENVRLGNGTIFWFKLDPPTTNVTKPPCLAIRPSLLFGIASNLSPRLTETTDLWTIIISSSESFEMVNVYNTQKIRW